MKYDIFISHASEDKETIVRPLAEYLIKLGVNVWYDEFSLKIGDSLSASLDLGLSKSVYGLIVISHSFLEKPWPDYELKSLITKEVSVGKTILPIWHGISKEELIQRSPYLADKLAINTGGNDIAKIASKIIEVVRPDIFKHLSRLQMWQEVKKNSVRRTISRKNVISGKKRHDKFDPPMLLRIKICYEVFACFLGFDIKTFHNNFKKEFAPTEELQVWELMTAVFIEYTMNGNIDPKAYNEVAKVLLLMSIKGISNQEFVDNLKHLTYQHVCEIIDTWNNVLAFADYKE